MQKRSEEKGLYQSFRKTKRIYKEILEAKKNYILKMTTKLKHSNTAPKMYWAILNRLPYTKDPAIPLLFVDGSFISEYCKKTNLFNNFFVSICPLTKSNSVFTSPFTKDQH